MSEHDTTPPPDRGAATRHQLLEVRAGEAAGRYEERDRPATGPEEPAQKLTERLAGTKAGSEGSMKAWQLQIRLRRLLNDSQFASEAP